MSKPAGKEDVEALRKQQQAMAAAQTAKELGAQSSQRFGGSLQFANGEGTSSSASALDAERKRRLEEEETTLGMLRKKYGI